MYPILFPNLGLELNISRVAFNIFGRDIYWYGIIILSAIVISIFLVKKYIKNTEIKWDDFIDFLIYAVVFGILGARLYYVAFKWDYYSKNLLDIPKIWNGGIAIYGAIISAIIVAIIFCKKRKINFFKFADLLVPYLALSQSVGRWGNFVNQEAYGSECNSFFKMGIFNIERGEYMYVHPTFLYESICTFLIFWILLLIRKNKKFDGEVFYLYMILYGIARAVVEGMRTDSLFLGDFRISQILAVIFVIVFVCLLVIKLKKNCKKLQ